MGSGQGALPRLAAAVAGVVVALGLLEIAVRVTVPPSATQILRGLHRATPEHPWLYELEPDTERRTPSGVRYATNHEGFRDRAWPRVKPADAFRIAVIGDSVTFGYGVALEQTFAKRLEERLRSDAAGPPFEVMNLGVSGYNPYTEAELLDGVVLGFAPDLVLVQFCVNDLNDPTQHFDASTMLALGAIPDAAFPDPARRATIRATVVPAPIHALCTASRLCSAVAEALAPAPAHDEMVAALAPREDPSAAELAWLEGLYGRMVRAARARGAALAVVVFPYETQLQPGGRDALQEKLRALGERAGVVVIDLLPAFRRAAADPGEEPLFLDMWHPSARGHAVAAEEIARALACARLVPDGAARCPS